MVLRRLVRRLRLLLQLMDRLAAAWQHHARLSCMSQSSSGSSSCCRSRCSHRKIPSASGRGGGMLDPSVNLAQGDTHAVQHSTNMRPIVGFSVYNPPPRNVLDVAAAVRQLMLEMCVLRQLVK